MIAYIEIKGRLIEISRKKMNYFVKSYPEIAKNTFVMDYDSYKILSDFYKNIIPNWE